MLLLPEGQTREAWAPFTKQCSYGNNAALHSKLLSHVLLTVHLSIILVTSQLNAQNLGSCIIDILYKECAKIKKIIPAPKG